MRTDSTRKRPVAVCLPPFGITAFTSRHGCGFRMPRMAHRYHKIVAVVGGRGELDLAAGRVGLDEATVLRVSPGMTHRFVDGLGTPMTLCVLCIDDRATNELPTGLWNNVVDRLGEGRATRIGAAEAAEVRRVARGIAIEATESAPHAAAVAVAYATQLLVRILRAARVVRPNRGVEDVAWEESMRWLRERFTDPIRISDLAARSGLSYRAYTAAFRARTGTSVVRFVTERRLALADRLIRETGDIATSAFEAGFGDLSHFYRIYARAFQCAPGARRASSRLAGRTLNSAPTGK